ncbi:peptide/nickel transport system substrate-binding protein [Actinocorallia herbida]|uniref:Peptide/nickel transport system substrate-binding protein n=1 Tax=Actinocorallia herbida TaxID=58109 RepID=A0A3N1CWN2_9ACTN|nr:ABC transporter substrate-binding protein [Actinocorallia herbida]ROO85709.1 peptide/nickel transport system substrate-binding protein [Actinocorallia herbida]
MRDTFADTPTAGFDRRSFLRIVGALGAATAITAGLSACGSDADGGGAAGGTREIEATLAFTLSGGFDPMNASSAVATAVNQHIFEALIDLDPVTREPYLALAAAQPKASADGLTWTVALREGAVFSDGSPVTAEDVAWSFTRALDPANKALMAGFISFIDRVKAKDAKTVEFELKAPFSLFAQRIAVIKIVPKAKTGDAAAAKAFDTAPIGSGPFTLTSADATSGVVMAANPAYKGSRPAKADKITLHTSPDNTARLNDLRSGQAQAIEAVPYLDAGTLGDEFKVDEKQAFNQLFLMFNCSAAPFDDKRVRQALHYAIDTDKVIATALQGYGVAATSYLDESNPGYQKAATSYGHDPEKAKALLAEAGVPNLSFELVTTDTGFVKDSAPVIIDAWKQIGVTATLNTNPSSAVYGTLVPSDDFRVLAASGDPSVFGPDADLLLRWFYYGETWPVARARWTDAGAKKCADLLDEAAESTDQKQKDTWKKALDVIAEEVPLYPVFHTKVITASDPDGLTGFQGASTTGLYFLDVARKG